MEAHTAAEGLKSTSTVGEPDLIAERLKTAGSPEERAQILAPCIGDAIRKTGQLLNPNHINVLDPENDVHQRVRKILVKTGVIPR